MSLAPRSRKSSFGGSIRSAKPYRQTLSVNSQRKKRDKKSEEKDLKDSRTQYLHTRKKPALGMIMDSIDEESESQYSGEA